MMNIPSQLAKLIANQADINEPVIKPIAASGSNRQYYRIVSSDGKSFIGTFNPDIRENKAFFYLSNHFAELNIPVPALFAISPDNQAYIQEDLGDISLYSLVKSEGFSDRVVNLYKKSLSKLVQMQVDGASGLKFDQCYPRESMDFQSFIWDLNYFKYYFLKPAGVPFDEQLLEVDFADFSNKLNSFPNRHFLFRDFQTRNIQVKNDEVYFIDYQGGRKGSPLYDAASIIYQSSTSIPEELKQELKQHYFSELKTKSSYTDHSLQIEFDYYLLIRLMQVLGAYGFRGLIEGKSYFRQSIPGALKNLKDHLNQFSALQFYPELYQVLNSCTEIKELNQEYLDTEELTIQIQSFSYRKTVPADPSGNGGGFVFDCRALPNPGREPAFRQLSGLDEPIIHYLQNNSEVEKFLQNALALVHQSIDSYLSRGFKHLVVNFGCTGGQHRSVYCAEKLARLLEGKEGIHVLLKHQEQGKSW